MVKKTCDGDDGSFGDVYMHPPPFCESDAFFASMANIGNLKGRLDIRTGGARREICIVTMEPSNMDFYITTGSGDFFSTNVVTIEDHIYADTLRGHIGKFGQCRMYGVRGLASATELAPSFIVFSAMPSDGSLSLRRDGIVGWFMFDELVVYINSIIRKK